MIQPRPWHAEARRMLDAGSSQADVARTLGLSDTTIKKFVDPAYHAAQMKCTLQRRNERLRSDPKYRDHVYGLQAKSKRAARLRKDAKCEAYDTGRRYEDVCAAWDITP